MVRTMKGEYSVVWSPTGQEIARIEATSPRKACRMAPLPYRKYLGELYAEPTNPNAYEGLIILKSEGFLLGGVRVHVSTPFASEQDAINWAKSGTDTNYQRPGYEDANITWRIRGVYAANPIPSTK